MAIPVNTRARIVAIKPIGSARLLHGLTATVVGPHPLGIPGWVEVRLDPNSVTQHVRWTVPTDRLEILEAEHSPLHESSMSPTCDSYVGKPSIPGV